MANQAIATDSYTANSKFTLGASASRGSVTVIGADTTFKGDITSKGDIVIAGTVEGEVASDAKITVSAGGVVTGRLAAHEVVLEGKLSGDAVGAKSVSLMNGSDLRGDVSTQVIMIEPGATFVGRCSMPEQGEKGATISAKS
jgi:cytoskeletal protein CcmA (bactofilin family)